MPAPSAFWLITCEHGGNRVPARWAHLFRGARSALDSHRGWDLGALSLFRSLAASLADARFHSTTSRLLVDLNRSQRHPRLFSEFSRNLDVEEREVILERYYRPYRDAVTVCVEQALTRHDEVVHIGVHSFTPVLNGVQRDLDIGLLYDPARPAELGFARAWAQGLRQRGTWRVRVNRPYRGVADGLATTLRRRFGPRYRGLELEVAQALWRGARWPTALRGGLVESLVDLRSSTQGWP